MEQLKQLTDQVLVERYIGGCNEAFDCLLVRYQEKLYHYILFHVNSEDKADDIFQETFVRAIVTLKQGGYTEKGIFYSWLTRIAHNLIIDQYRSEAGANLVSHDDDSTDVLNNANLVENYHEATMVNEQTLKDVRRLMEHLPEQQREVVFMRFYQELSFKEISDITGVSINTSLGRMRYALLNMRRMAREHNISLELI